jgi:hypothetical protein
MQRAGIMPRFGGTCRFRLVWMAIFAEMDAYLTPMGGRQVGIHGRS